MITKDLAWRVAMIALAALTVTAALGCGRRHTVVVRDAGRGQRYQESLIRLAARDTGCHPGQLTPMQIGQEPGVYTVTGCTVPMEYWLHCVRRGRNCQWRRIPTLNEQAAPLLGCAPQMIQQQFTQAPNVRLAAGCGRQGTFQMGCNGAACGWGMTGAVGGGGAPPPGYGGGVAVEPTAAQGGQETAALSAQLQQQREAILSCVDQPMVNLTLRWTAQGIVQVALPPEMAGSAAEGCIQAALGTLRVAASQPGQLSIVVH
ncbi:MAG: hypothetical protein KF729_21000 [Sandaracinaceae bacterium]|nr:hypothetical protein [Sandaracinaceae bacterium]